MRNLWNLVTVIRQLSVLSGLLREQNQLTRELITTLSHRLPTTLRSSVADGATPTSTLSSFTPTPLTPPRKRTAADVFRVTPEMREQQELDRQAVLIAPHRYPTGEVRTPPPPGQEPFFDQDLAPIPVAVGPEDTPSDVLLPQKT